MAESKGTKSGGGTAGSGASADGRGAPEQPRVQAKNLWPIPALGLATALLVGGLTVVLVNRPKPPASLPLEVALEAVKDEKYEDAIDMLKGQGVQRFLASAEATDEQRAAFYVARARSIFGAQERKGISVEANFRSVVDDYAKADELMKGSGEGLDATDTTRIAESLLAVGDVEKALAAVRSLPAGEQARKTRLTKRIVEKNLASADPRGEMTIDLLAALASDPELSSVDKAWVLARQSELLIAAGQTEDAINRLVRRIGLLRDVPADTQGELYLLLAKAYFLAGQPQAAAKQLEAAETLVDRASELRGLMGVMQGQLAQSAGNLETAKERYLSVITDFAGGPYHAQALMGLAEVEAAIGAQDADVGDRVALERYSELVELVKRPAGSAKAKPEGGHAAGGEGHGGGHTADGHGATSDAHAGGAGEGGSRLGGVGVKEALASLVQRITERFDSGNKDSSLRYALLAETMFADADVPAELLLSIGRAHRALGDEVMEQARMGQPEGVEFRVQELDVTTQAEVRKHYTIAGEYLARHASSVSSTDQAAYADSLWNAADSYDRAGELDEARKAFATYADGATDNDPNRPAARFRLAQVFQAQADYGSAASLYRQLVQSRGAPGAPGSSGPWADRAVVPLARCLLADKDQGNDAEAERLLLGVVDGSTVTPDAAAYRDALIELGSTYYSTQRYPEAIGWLEQAIKRYKDDRRIDAVRYRLADSHRLEAQRIAKALETKLPQTQADELIGKREEHLVDARRLYAEVRASLESRTTRLDSLEKVYMRNAYFYAGDCAFEQKDYEGAIAAYDTARLKYAEDPASLVAMAQIVSAYIAQKQWAQARTANERARQQLARFPESVWSRPDLPMEKRHWEKWLEARTILEQSAGAEGGK